MKEKLASSSELAASTSQQQMAQIELMQKEVERLRNENLRMRDERNEAIANAVAAQEAQEAGRVTTEKHARLEDEKALMLQEAHRALVNSNGFLLRELEDLRARHTHDALQWQKNYTTLRETMKSA